MKKYNRTRDEYGGFLPLELNPGAEWFSPYQDHLMRFNSVKAAIACLIGKLKLKNLCIPYYYCPSTIQAIKDTGVSVSFYHIDQNLLPLPLEDKEGNAYLLTDYFGIRYEEIKRIANHLCGSVVLLDLAHGFFDPPLMADHVYNIYSAKKFFGIPDGAYLIGTHIRREPQPANYSDKYAGYLLKTYERGTNAAYAEKKEADRAIAAQYGPMSLLAKGLLENVDYQRVRAARAGNFRTYADALSAVNGLATPGEVPAYHYPLYLPDAGKRVKKALVSRRIYVPTLWDGEDLLRDGLDWEVDLSRNTVFLPVDQRYNALDIRYIVQTVKELL